MCYVPKKDEGETNVSGKFVDSCSVFHKIGGCFGICSSGTQRKIWATKGVIGIKSKR